MSVCLRSRFPLIGASLRPRVTNPCAYIQGFRAQRHFFSFARKSKPAASGTTLDEDDLFHSFSESPFPTVRARAEAIRSLAPCPVCASSHAGHTGGAADTKPLGVKFECPDCGWPTHCTGEHWEIDEDHAKFCSRLREVNEDEHDLRSGRKMHEFELPGAYGVTASRYIGLMSPKRTTSVRGSYLIC